MDHEKHFLELLDANEDDNDTRVIYADWLDEAGRYEEAQRQRAWPAAKAWMVEAVEQYNGRRREEWERYN